MHENLSIKYNAHTRRSNLSTHVPPPTSSGKPCCSLTLLSSSPPPHQKKPPHPSYRADPLTNPPPACVLLPTARPIPSPTSRADGPYSLVLFTSPTCPAEHTTIPFIACLSAPFSERKRGERGGGERGGSGGGYKNKKKRRKQLNGPSSP